MNKVLLIGRLTADPELKQTPNGTPVCSFRIAIKRRQGASQADFINVVSWRSQGEFVSKYFAKGKLIEVEGKLCSRGYTDKNGNKVSVVEVISDSVHFAESQDRHSVTDVPHSEECTQTPEDAYPLLHSFSAENDLSSVDAFYENFRAFEDYNIELKSNKI